MLTKEAGKMGISVDVVMFNAATSAFEAVSKWQMIFQLGREMVFRHLFLDSTTCNAAASACEKSGKWAQTLWLLHRSHLHGRPEPDIFTFASAVGACNPCCNWRRVLILIVDACQGRLQPNAILHEKILDILWERGKLLQMQGFISQMKTICSQVLLPASHSGACDLLAGVD